jgi:geranylgeranyl pyrophosphate synthase
LDTLTELAIDIDHYLNIADLKTGSLFSAASGIGGVLGGANPHEVDCLYNYGRAVGIAFQIKDDVLDTSADPARQERVNLVVMHYLDEATRRERVSNLLDNSDKNDKPQVKELYEKALQFALKKSKEHVEKAKAELKGLKDPSRSKLLEEFADYSLERSY